MTTVNNVVQVATLRYSKRADNVGEVVEILIPYVGSNSTHFLEELKNIRNNFDVCDDFVFYFNEVNSMVVH